MNGTIYFHTCRGSNSYQTIETKPNLVVPSTTADQHTQDPAEIAAHKARMAVNLPGHIQLVGEPGHFYTVLAVQPDQQQQQEEEEEQVEEQVGQAIIFASYDRSFQISPQDLLVCGRCRAQFSDLALFLSHKKQQCSSSQQKQSSSQAGPAVFYTVQEEELLAEQSQLYLQADPPTVGHNRWQPITIC